MSSTSSTQHSNWHQYFNLLQAQCIPEREQRFYMAHLQAFLRFFPNRRMSSLKQGEILGYFHHLAQKPVKASEHEQHIQQAPGRAYVSDIHSPLICLKPITT